MDVVRAAPHWAVPSLILGGAAVKAGIASAENFRNGKSTKGLIEGGLSLATLSGSIFTGFASFLYYTEYFNIKKVLVKRGWDERIVADQVTYPCGYRAAKIASQDAGFSSEFEDFTNKVEAKWWIL